MGATAPETFSEVHVSGVWCQELFWVIYQIINTLEINKLDIQNENNSNIAFIMFGQCFNFAFTEGDLMERLPITYL